VSDRVRLLRGGLAVDDRGQVSFVNDFDFAGVRRCYMVENHRSGFIRAWHAHRREAKYVHVVSGAALVCAVQIDDWQAPSKEAEIHRHVLSERAPAVLYIPAGYANGFMTLADRTKIQFFSTSSLEDSLQDDVRYGARYWDPWTVEER
jgi:dTDP-4-dehydrorhamnose 3,5-epimerase-like enzyme